ncbi:MAG TPA: alpha/beta fold hydrolase [Longimicrobiales bacterium]|nr:alpha/beta fold hydrolase [Longimicrobiales bacterium]
MPSTLRFLKEFLRPSPDRVVAEETSYRRGDEALEATLYRPAGARGPLPGWVTLHGLTYYGRKHQSLDRFARALAASGAAVLVPDLPEWRRLEVAPGPTVDTIRAAVLELDGRGVVEPGRIAVMGFSFGGTQALVAASDPALEGHLAGIASWGGYGDMRRVARFMFLGEHELDGERFRADVDPYGCWILTGNYLTLLPEHRQDRALADAVLGLALEAGRLGVMSWSPETDAMKAAARERLDARQREIFDLVAPPAGESLDPDRREALRDLTERTIDAALAHEPLLDPTPYLTRVPVPIFLAHGRDDRLIPWTEMVRLERALPPERLRRSGITALFAHSFGEKRLPSPSTFVEAFRFVRLLRAMVRLV